MRWLEGSPIDLETGSGGVEVHARAVAAALRARGVEVVFSKDPSLWADPSFDVVRTHGSALPLERAWERKAPRTRWIHTFHGSTLGRIRACAEWAWIGGWSAWGRELLAARRADALSFVRPGLEFERIARARKVPQRMIANGWDAGGPLPLPESFPELSGRAPRFAFIGRGEDRVKGADRALRLMADVPGIEWVAVPGTGFPDHYAESPNLGAPTRYRKLAKTGTLSSAAVQRLLCEGVDGVLIPSRYEGNALVALEALSSGARVVTSPVGAHAWLADLGVRGLHVARANDEPSLALALREAMADLPGSRARREDAEANRSLLPSWGTVADRLLEL